MEQMHACFKGWRLKLVSVLWTHCVLLYNHNLCVCVSMHICIHVSAIGEEIGLFTPQGSSTWRDITRAVLLSSRHSFHIPQPHHESVWL
jgi:hypothetical protein